jgi:hypothetical protein
MLESVLNFKQILNNLTSLQSSVSSGMLMIIFFMAFGILEKKILWLQVTLMQIGLAMWMIERVILEDVFM